jgi:hypothetical protein
MIPKGEGMKLSFAARVEWNEAGAHIPELTDAEVVEVLNVYRPTPDNRICYCQGESVCPYCMLTQIIDQLRRPPDRMRAMTMIGVEFGYKSSEKGMNLEATMARAVELYDDAKEFTRKT